MTDPPHPIATNLTNETVILQNDDNASKFFAISKLRKQLQVSGSRQPE